MQAIGNRLLNDTELFGKLCFLAATDLILRFQFVLLQNVLNGKNQNYHSETFDITFYILQATTPSSKIEQIIFLISRAFFFLLFIVLNAAL